METKTKNIVAILMATIIAMALFTPMAMAEDTTVNLQNSPPYICCKWEEDSEVIASCYDDFYVSPLAPEVTIKACVCDPNVDPASSEIEAEIESVTATVTGMGIQPRAVVLNLVMEGGSPVVCDCVPECMLPCECIYEGYNGQILPCYLYEHTLTMDGCDPAGMYTVTVEAMDYGGCEAEPVENEFFYDEAVVPEIDFTKVDYGNVEIGVHTVVGQNDEYQIHNAGNLDGVVTITGTPMTRTPPGYPTVNMNLDASIGNENNIPLPHTFSHVFVCCEWTPVMFSIKPPAGLPAGTYTGTITIGMSAAP